MHPNANVVATVTTDRLRGAAPARADRQPPTRRRSRSRSAFQSLAVPLAVLATTLSWLNSSDAAWAQFEPTIGTASPSYCIPAALSFGAAPESGTISGAGETDCWRLTAAAGDRVRVRAVGTSGSLAPQVQIASSACSAGPAAEVTCTFATQGSVTVLVRDAARSQSGGYAISVQRLNDPVGCSALAFDATTRTGAIAAGETDCWRFTGAAGDRVRVRLVTPAAALAPLAEVLRPDGTIRCAPNGAENQTCVLDASGTHTILVRDAAVNVGGYSLGVQRLNNPAGCTPKPFATTASLGVITTTGETDCWRFPVTAGDRVRIRAVKTSGALNPVVEVLRPSGTTRCNPTTTDDVTCQLDITGTHTILVHDSGGTATGNYLLSLQRLNDPVGCPSLSYGTTVTAESLATSGKTDCWRLTGAVGDHVRLRVVDTTGVWSPVAEVLDGSGRTVCNPVAGVDTTCVLDGSGSHTILVRDWLGTRTGDYRVSIQRLDDPVGCSQEPGSAGSDGWASMAEVNCWRVEGEAGDLLRIRVIDGGWNWSPVAEVVRPDGSTVCSRTSTDSFTCELDADGTHTILVQSAAGRTFGGYRIAVIRLNDDYYNCPNLATSPSAHDADIIYDGEIDCYTSWAPEAGNRELRVEATSGMLEPVVEVLKPDGTLRCLRTSPDGWFDCYGDMYEYQRILVYDAGGTNAGNYEIDRR